MRAPIVVPTQTGYSKGPEPAHANDYQVHPEEVPTLSAAVIPFASRAVPTGVIPSLVPLHLGTGQVRLYDSLCTPLSSLLMWHT